MYVLFVLLFLKVHFATSSVAKDEQLKKGRVDWTSAMRATMEPPADLDCPPIAPLNHSPTLKGSRFARFFNTPPTGKTMQQPVSQSGWPLRPLSPTTKQKGAEAPTNSLSNSMDYKVLNEWAKQKVKILAVEFAVG